MADIHRILTLGRSLITHSNYLRRFITSRPTNNLSHNCSGQMNLLRTASSVSSPKSTPPPETDQGQPGGGSGIPGTAQPGIISADGLDAPIRFTTSEASQWKATETLYMKRRPDNELPWFQPYVVIFSVACFLLWFGIFREENDIDEELGKPLWERIPGLEKSQLNTLIKYNRDNGIPTTDLEARLKEIKAKELQNLKK